MTVTDQEGSQLPEGWAQTRIGDICDLINGRAFKPTEWTTAGIPIIRIQNLNDPAAEFNYCNFKVEEKYLVDNGQLLFAWSGTPETSFGAHIWNRGKAVLNQHIFKVNINENYLNKTFLKHLLNRNVKEYIGKAHGTAGLAHITKGKFEVSIIFLPPSNEQWRIASKVEELFSFLDAGTESLRKVQAQLKRYRQAVLKYAFEGKLTEEWRKTHKDQIEPAWKLLGRIRNNKDASQNKKMPLLVTDDLAKLPDTWQWVRLGDVADLIQYGTSEKTNLDKNGIPILRMGNIQDGKLDFQNLKYLSKETPGLQAYFLGAGDVLFNRTNSAELVGKTAVYQKKHIASAFASYLIRVRMIKESCDPELLSYYINSYFGRNYINSVVSQQVGQANVNGTKLSMMPVPLISRQEQEKLRNEIERLISLISETEKIVLQELKQAEFLRQGLLKEAFAGRLVPQDPVDEPAEKLLARIKVEQTNNNKYGINKQLEMSGYVK